MFPDDLLTFSSLQHGFKTQQIRTPVNPCWRVDKMKHCQRHYGPRRWLLWPIILFCVFANNWCSQCVEYSAVIQIQSHTLRHTASWEELHCNVCACICMTTQWQWFYTMTMIYRIVTVFVHNDYDFTQWLWFTVFHNHTNLFTIFLLYVIIPGFCCPHVTNLNLVLLL